MTSILNVHPYTSTAEEVMSQYELTSKERSRAIEQINAIGCPFFSKRVYALTHHFCSQQIHRRKL